VDEPESAHLVDPVVGGSIRDSQSLGDLMN